MKKRSIFILIIVVFAIFGTYFFYPSSIHQPPKGIILISLDTLRADHLSTYGYHRDTSPYIDAFAQESIVFENALVQAPRTLPSHMSIMTSLYPHSHGASNNRPLAQEHVTLAELLQKGGYQTAAFTDGAWMRAIFGFDQGFDSYDGEKRTGIANILPKVEKWLQKNKSKPFFLFIHCYDIHAPYNPPAPYDTIFKEFPYTGNFIPNNKKLGLAVLNKLRLNDQDVQHTIDLYDGGIRYTDAKIGGFLKYLRDSGLYNESLIIITSDHGEEFKEHGSFGHWQLYYKPNLHVPLIMHIPTYPRKEVRVNEFVQSIDLLPTILDIAELPAHPAAQGKSLIPLIKSYGGFFNCSLRNVVRFFKKDVPIFFAEGYVYLMRGKNISVISNGYQMIYNEQSHSLQLFNIQDDPLAKDNIAQNHTDIVEHLWSAYTNSYNQLPSFQAPVIVLDGQTQEQLQALGYVDALDPAVNLEDDFSFGSISFEDDSDLDGVPNKSDNCVYVPNYNQEDKDKDGIGDICDNCLEKSKHDKSNGTMKESKTSMRRLY